MNTITFRSPRTDEFDRVSAQIAESYKATYQGMMRQAYLDSLSDTHWIPILQEGAARGDTCIIAEIDCRVVGSVVYGRSGKMPNTADLHAIYLSPHFIGQGVGHRLYSKMENAMRRQGFKSCSLEVLTQNGRAISFYLHHGYSIADTFTVRENGMVLECHIMKKDL